MSLASTEWAAGREPEKKRSENMLVYHDMQESHAARLCMEKIALLCVTAVSNGNVELKVGVLPVHSARTVPTIGLFPILCLGIACSLKDGLPSSTMEKTKKKRPQYSKYGLLVLLHQGQQTYNPPPSSRRASQDRQVDNSSRMCFSSLKIEQFFFCSLKSDR